MTTSSTYPDNLANPQTLDLREYINVLRRGKWMVLAVTVIVVAAALAFSFQQTPIYQSTAEVLVTPGTAVSEQNVNQEDINLENETELAGSFQVARLAANRLGFDVETRGFRSNVTIEQGATDSDILLTSYTSSSAVEAQRRAGAFANAYLDDRYERLLSQSEQVSNQLEIVKEQLQGVTDELVQTVDEAERENLNTRSQRLIDQVTTLQQQEAALKPTSREAVGRVFEPPTVPSVPVSPNHIRNAVLALLVGFALGIGLVFLREHLDEGLNGRSDLEARLGTPVLAVIPTARSWRSEKQPFLVAVAEPDSPVTEAYRTLRTGVQFAANQRRARALLVTGGNPTEGKTATTANLGVVLAQAGKRVILISGDLRKPRLHNFFGINNKLGLTNVLAGEAKLWEAVVPTGIENLRLLPSGPIPGNPAELLGSEPMRALLAELREISDYVLLDSPPVLAVADAITVAPSVDGVLFVADAQATMRGSVDSSRQYLEQVNARLIGAVLNNVQRSTKSGEGAHYAPYTSYRSKDGDSRPLPSLEDKRRSLKSTLGDRSR